MAFRKNACLDCCENATKVLRIMQVSSSEVDKVGVWRCGRYESGEVCASAFGPSAVRDRCASAQRPQSQTPSQPPVQSACVCAYQASPPSRIDAFRESQHLKSYQPGIHALPKHTAAGTGCDSPVAVTQRRILLPRLARRTALAASQPHHSLGFTATAAPGICMRCWRMSRSRRSCICQGSATRRGVLP